MTQAAANELGEMIQRGFRSVRVFSGRDTRPQFWLYLAVVYGILQLASFALPVVAAVQWSLGYDPEANGTREAATVFVLVALVVLLAAAVTRRLHDTGRRGAWALLPLLPTAVFIPGSTWALDQPVSSEAEAPASFVVVWAAGVASFAAAAAVVVLCLLPGTAGPNRYGPATTPPPSPPFMPPPPYVPPPPGV